MTPRDGYPRFSVTSAWCGDARHRLPWAPATGSGPSASGGPSASRPKGLGPLDPRLRSCPTLGPTLGPTHGPPHGPPQGPPQGPAHQPRDLHGSLSVLFGLDAREPS